MKHKLSQIQMKQGKKKLPVVIFASVIHRQMLKSVHDSLGKKDICIKYFQENEDSLQRGK